VQEKCPDCSSTCLPLPGVEQKQQHVHVNKQKTVMTTFSDNISPELSRIRIMDTARSQETFQSGLNHPIRTIRSNRAVVTIHL